MLHRHLYAMALFICIGSCVTCRAWVEESQSPATQPATTQAALPDADDEDLRVLARVAEDFLAQVDADQKRTPPQQAITKVLVHVQSSPPGHFMSAGQMIGDTRSFKISDELFADFTARNQAPVSLAKLGDHSRAVIVTDLKRLFATAPARVHEPNLIRETYPGARDYISFWLPGYTKDRETALVRISFGWTPHGACATFMLKRDKSGWHVVNRDFCYYA